MTAIIGDIHGSFYTLKELCETITSKYNISHFIFLGDLIDRGENSKLVVDFIIELKDNYNLTVLRGNHEEMLISFLSGDNRFPTKRYRERVGLSTIASFLEVEKEKVQSIATKKIIDSFKNYKLFFENTIEYYIIEPYNKKFLFSHAGPAFKHLPPDRQYYGCTDLEQSLRYPYLWHRLSKEMEERYEDYIVVFGHDALVHKYCSESDKENVLPYINKKKDNGEIISIDIDTGCVYGGKLSAMIIDNDGSFVFESFTSKDHVEWF